MAHRPLVVPTSILSISPNSNNRWAFKRLCSSIGYCHLLGIAYSCSYVYLLFQSVILIRIDHAEARTEFLRQPCLFDATFLRHFFYPVYGLVHTFYLTLVYKGIKYHAIKREKRKKTLPLLHLIRCLRFYIAF